MKRNVFGATIVAGGLALFTSVSGFAGNLTADSATTAISDCAKTVVYTDPATLSNSDAKSEATALNAETKAALVEMTAEANNAIAEVVAETTDEDGARGANALNAQLTEIAADACKAIASLKAEYDATMTELKAAKPEVKPTDAETQNVEKQGVEKQDVEKPESEKRDSQSKPSEKRGSGREGND